MKTKDQVVKWSFPLDNFKRQYVSFEEYEEIADYCDRLVEFGNLPCLPKDFENLRNANLGFAVENQALKKENEKLKNSLRRASMENIELEVSNGFLEEDRDRLASKLYTSERRYIYLKLATDQERIDSENKLKSAVENSEFVQKKLDFLKSII